MTFWEQVRPNWADLARQRWAQRKYPNMFKLEQNPDYSERPPVVIWRSRPVAKSAHWQRWITKKELSVRTTQSQRQPQTDAVTINTEGDLSTATATAKINDLIGRKKKNNRAARAALSLVQRCDVVCQMTTWNFYIRGSADSTSPTIRESFHENHSCQARENALCLVFTARPTCQNRRTPNLSLFFVVEAVVAS